MAKFKAQFIEFYIMNKDEEEHIWRNGIIVPDTNVLLHFLRQDKNQVQLLFEKFEKYKERLWIPHQVALEYHRNAHDRMDALKGHYDGVAKALSDHAEKLRSVLGPFKPHPLINVDEIYKEYLSFTNTIVERLKQSQNEHPTENYFSETMNSLSLLIGDDVGEPFSDASLDAQRKIAETRFNAQRPPGYRNAEKTNGNEYGDYFLWRQILDYAKEKGKPVIFVTDEGGEDWWERSNGMTRGPRRELVREFRDETKNGILMYRLDGFIRKSGVHKENIELVEALEQQHAERALRAKDNILRARELKMLYGRKDSLQQRLADIHSRLHQVNIMMAEEKSDEFDQEIKKLENMRHEFMADIDHTTYSISEIEETVHKNQAHRGPRTSIES